MSNQGPLRSFHDLPLSGFLSAAEPPTGSPHAYRVGDRVRKFSGDYNWEGTVRAVFLTWNGQTRYVVGHPVEYGEVLHIYNHNQLLRTS